MEQNLTLEAARELGFLGGEPSEAERLLFEAWMLGHCWKIHGDWDGKSYTHATEKGGGVHGGAMQTRQLWAVWRDRAALEAKQSAERDKYVEQLKSDLTGSLNDADTYSRLYQERRDAITGLQAKLDAIEKQEPVGIFYKDAKGRYCQADVNPNFATEQASMTKLYAAPTAQQPAQQAQPEPWPVRGVRVEGDKVIIAVKGGNDAARWLCGEVLAKHTVQPEPDFAALEREHLGDPDKKTGIYEPMCFLQDSRSYVGNCPMWWKNGGGYTTRIDEAKRFTIEAALRQSRSRDTDVAWLCADIEPLMRPTIDHQEMRDIKPVPVAEHKKPDDTEGGAL